MNENLLNNTSEFGILTQKGHPLFSYWLTELMKLNLGKFSIIIESTMFSEKNLKHLSKTKMMLKRGNL